MSVKQPVPPSSTASKPGAAKPTPRAKGKDDKASATKKGKPDELSPSPEPAVVAETKKPKIDIFASSPFDSISDLWRVSDVREQRERVAALMATELDVVPLCDGGCARGFCTHSSASLRLDACVELVRFASSLSLTPPQVALLHLVLSLLFAECARSPLWLDERVRLLLVSHCSERLNGTEPLDTDHLLPVPTWLPREPLEPTLPVPAAAALVPQSLATKGKANQKPPSRPVSRGTKKEPVVEATEPVAAPVVPVATGPPSLPTSHLSAAQVDRVYSWLHSRFLSRIELIRLAMDDDARKSRRLPLQWRTTIRRPHVPEIRPLEEATGETPIVEEAKAPEPVIETVLDASAEPVSIVDELPLPAAASELSPQEYAKLVETRAKFQSLLSEQRALVRAH